MNLNLESNRGLERVIHPTYAYVPVETRLVGRSSAIGDYDDSCDNPGTSFLWIGKDHHLNREEVSELVEYLVNWLNTGKLST